MFTLLKYWFRNDNPLKTGALLDNRQPDEKKDDIQFDEIVASANYVSWLTKPSYRSFPELDQERSFTCGANALSKALGISFAQKYGRYIQFSRADIYQRRNIKPQQGMYLYDMFNIASEGVTLEDLVNKSLSTDEDYDGADVESWAKDIGKVFTISKGVYIQNDIDTIASVISTTGKGVILTTYFLGGEWARYIPVIIDPTLSSGSINALRHFVTAVDYTLVDGKKYLVIEDSAHFGGLSQRLVSEEWVKNRVTSCAYPMNFKFMLNDGGKPTYDGFTVISAQECLRYEGMFPTNVSYSENVGPVTRKALALFQTKYGLKVTQSIDIPTKNKLALLYP
jgi:hypothetical protein